MACNRGVHETSLEPHGMMQAALHTDLQGQGPLVCCPGHVLSTVNSTQSCNAAAQATRLELVLLMERIYHITPWALLFSITTTERKCQLSGCACSILGRAPPCTRWSLQLCPICSLLALKLCAPVTRLDRRLSCILVGSVEDGPDNPRDVLFLLYWSPWIEREILFQSMRCFPIRRHCRVAEVRRSQATTRQACRRRVREACCCFSSASQPRRPWRCPCCGQICIVCHTFPGRAQQR
mmetsp:Transcript_147351/g.259830  ORF Transcript_147351/g.259830 Transcript_147351/m.259830 type:complete len:237 (+) Transcript_147351:973-1683(+)